MKKNKWQIILVLGCLVMWLLVVMPSRDSKPDAPADGTWEISYEQGSRSEGFWKCEATDTLVYFCYFDQCVIDAYDYQGKYQFTITLPDSQNGGTSIHCTADLLYAEAKNNTVYVFDGTELVQTMTHDQAEQLGCDFLNLDSNLYVSADTVYKIDEAGSRTALFSVPEAVAESMSFFDYGDRQQKNLLLGALSLSGFAMMAAAIIWIGFIQKKSGTGR